jgi:hypothetical protein
VLRFFLEYNTALPPQLWGWARSWRTPQLAWLLPCGTLGVRGTFSTVNPTVATVRVPPAITQWSMKFIKMITKNSVPASGKYLSLLHHKNQLVIAV